MSEECTMDQSIFMEIITSCIQKGKNFVHSWFDSHLDQLYIRFYQWKIVHYFFNQSLESSSCEQTVYTSPNCNSYCLYSNKTGTDNTRFIIETRSDSCEIEKVVIVKSKCCYSINPDEQCYNITTIVDKKY